MKYYPSKDTLWNEECKYVIGYCQGFGLDVGAGQRTLAPHLLTNDNAVLGCDFSYEADNLKFKDKYFDFVYASHIIEHMVDPLKAIREWIRVVKITGYIVIICPDKRFTPTLGNMQVDAQHKADYSYEQMRELIKLIDNVEIVSKNPNALPNFSMLFVLRRIK